jgi:hypothetical protein
MVSFADRDLLFRDCRVVSGTGASAGSLHPAGAPSIQETARDPLGKQQFSPLVVLTFAKVL